MSHLDTAFKLGSVRAAQDFESWLDGGLDNPTGAPPKSLGKLAAEHVLQKIGKSKKDKPKPYQKKPTQRVTRAPMGKGTRFKTLRAKLKRKK